MKLRRKTEAGSYQQSRRKPEYFFDIEQGTPEWHLVRCGIPTASKFSAVLAIGKDGKASSVMRRKYLYQLAGEILTGEPADTYQNFDMLRGKEREPEARSLYVLRTGNTIERVGFVKHNGIGASPDSLIGDDGLLEVKDAIASVQIERLVENRCPPEHVPQVQGQLMVTGRAWCDFMSHCRGLPPLIVRVPRNEEYIDELRKELKLFQRELAELVDKINNLD